MKTVWEESQGNALLRIVERSGELKGVIIRDGKLSKPYEHEDLTNLKTVLRNGAGKTHPDYFGWEGAINRFQKYFPDGFKSEIYLSQERNYKKAASEKLCELIPLDAVYSMTDMGEAALSVFRETNLLASFEQMRVQDLCRSSEADEFIRGAADFAQGDIKAGLNKMKGAAKYHDAAKWTICTYLPYFWFPKTHIYLKPQVTKDFAFRIGHHFADAYDATLAPETYTSLLDLAGETFKKVNMLKPKDNIDIQSFIWVVGAYVDE